MQGSVLILFSTPGMFC